jgi:hypothetical protein
MASIESIQQLIDENNRAAALPLAAAYVKANPNDVEGWYLLAQALENRDRQRQALQRGLRVDPGHSGVRSMLAEMGVDVPPLPDAPKPSAFTESPFTETGNLMPELAAISPKSKAQNDDGAAELPPVTRRNGEEEGTPFSWDRDILGIHEGQPAVQAEEMKEAKPVRDDQAQAQSETEGAAIESIAEPESDVQVQTISEEVQLESNGRGAGWFGWLLGIMLLGVIVSAAVLGLDVAGYISLGPEPTFTSMAEQPAVSPAQTLPPTWTPSVAPTHTASAIPTETPTPTSTPRPILLPELRREMEFIQMEVAALRDKPSIEEVNNELIPLIKLRMLVMELLIDENALSDLEIERIVFAALGFLDPDYDLTKAAVDHAADALGGFYVPEPNNLYVVGTTFGGFERYVYAHEFMHALQDQYYDLSSMGIYPVCERPQQECQAMRALIEGEASVVMDIWLLEYATEEDFTFISVYVPSTTLFSDEEPPPIYYSYNGQFAYGFGQAFVERLLEEANGNWTLVDRAFAERLPETTEQILHPEKYFAGEGGKPVSDPELSSALGDGWTLIEKDALGEWQTYLLLAAANAPASRLSDSRAAQAAAGWGGDHYQIYYNEGSAQFAMSAHWAWDTRTDANQFASALVDSLDGRYAGASISLLGNADCWTNSGEFSCVFQNGNDVLWLLAPELGDLEAVKALFPGF